MTMTTHPGAPTVRRVLGATVGAGAVAALAGMGGAAWAGLLRQARSATTTIVTAAQQAAADEGLLTPDAAFAWQALPPVGDGVYLPDGTGPLADGPAGTLVLTVLGDSTAVGYGCAEAGQLPGVLLARAAAATLGRPVRLTCHGAVGSGAAALATQLIPALGDGPDAVAIMVGANDVKDRIAPRASAALLRHAVATLTGLGVPTVVGTCPDLGVIVPIPQPLRAVAHVWSMRLAAAQKRAVRAAGGVPVPLAQLVSPQFYGRPDLFYADGFHPSAPGYALAAGALEPFVTEALRTAA